MIPPRWGLNNDDLFYLPRATLGAIDSRTFGALKMCKSINILKTNFPLKDVNICKVDSLCDVANPIYSDTIMKVNQQEFSIDVEGVGSFFAKNGNYIEFCPTKDADPEWINLSLNSQMLVALLHQRKIINFHASSFIFNDTGIMLLGETGAGKSSITASFVLNGAGFLSDDLTAVTFKSDVPLIWPVYRKIRLHKETIQQLSTDFDLITEEESITGKYWLKVKEARVDHTPLHIIFKLEIHEGSDIKFAELKPDENFALLRSEICSWEMLKGMPDTEAAYLQQLIDIVHHVKIVKVVRPRVVDISEMHEAIVGFLNGTERLRDLETE